MTGPREFGSRCAFLDALTDIAPYLLEELKSQVSDPYRAVWSHHAVQHTDLAQLQILVARELQHSVLPQLQILVARERTVLPALLALNHFLTAYHMVDGWLLEAALTTVYNQQGFPTGLQWLDDDATVFEELKSQVCDPHRAVWSLHVVQHSDLVHLQNLAVQDRATWLALEALNRFSVELRVRSEYPNQYPVEEDRIRLAWFQNSVLDAIYTIVRPESRRWCYFPRDLHFKPFEFKHRPWFPVSITSISPPESRSEYRALAAKAFNLSIDAYQTGQELMCSSRKINLRGHALWTAKRFLGQSYREIAEQWKKSGDVEEAVRRGVSRFAKAIRLTLP